MLAVLVVLGIPALLLVTLLMLQRVRRRVTELEAQVAWLRQNTAQHVSPAAAFDASQSRAPEPAFDATPEPTLADLVRRAPEPSPAPAPHPIRAAAPAAASVSVDSGALPPPLPPRQTPAAPAYPRSAVPPRAPRGTGPFDVVRRWFTEGNVPVKVGVVVLFAGVAALLKYASDQGFLRLPIEFRLAGIAAAAIGALVFGWRQRVGRRSFGLAVQGGAIGVLLLVLFASFKLYHLLPAGAAFAGSVALVAGLGVLAVRQESLALAVLGVLAGFLAPIWLSTGHGNHVALFGYYAVLNAGIVAIAWRRPWRLLNLMGFAFTFGIGAAWGALQYRPEQFGSTEPFLLLFFAMYLAIPILYAAAGAPRQKRVFDGSLVFGTPLVAFVMQAGLLHNDRLELAYCALALGAIYAVIAAALRSRAVFAPLIAPYAVLAVGFATLAVPLALSAQATSATFALEGAGLVWFALRQQRRLPLAAGLLLQMAAAVAFAFGMDAMAGDPAILNGRFMAALLMAIGGFASALACRRHDARALALIAYAWGMAWWLGNGLAEIDRCIASHHRIDAAMLFLVATGWLAAEVGSKLASRTLRWTATIALLAPIALVWAQLSDHHQPFSGLGGMAWLAFAALGARILMTLRASHGSERAIAHIGFSIAWATVCAVSLYVLADDASLGDGWRFAAAALPWLALMAAVHAAPRVIAWPFADAADEWRDESALAVGLVLAGFVAVGLTLPGNPAPLPFMPVVNPLELVQIAALALLAARARAAGVIRIALPMLACATFVVATFIVLRGDHQWGRVAWSPTMLSTGLVQTSLTVLWSVIGMAAWVSGSRRLQRGLWQAGAVLMTLVLAKLVLVDRQYLGNLLGIGSFIAFGLLCTAVGYLAPVPPRRAEPEIPA